MRAGRLDADAVDAVLVAAGHRVGRRRDGPAGLTAREVDVLRLLARGLSSKEIAAELVISPKTARNHIEHIYTKTGASSRVTASLFAMQHGLLPDDRVTLNRIDRWGNCPMTGTDRISYVATTVQRQGRRQPWDAHDDLRAHLRPPDGQGRTGRACAAAARLLAAATGRVLEIGAGTGANLPYYGTAVESLTLTEPEPPMFRRLRQRAQRAGAAGHGATGAG